jgi:hypothetical protein
MSHNVMTLTSMQASVRSAPALVRPARVVVG